MQTKLYELEMRLPTAPRMRHGKGMSYMDPLYRQAQYDFRSAMIDKYGRFETIEPTKRITAAPSKGRAEQPPYRNVVVSYCAMLAGNTAVDKDNVEKFLLDSLGPLTARQPTKKDLALEWQPCYKNDRQVVGGDQLVVDNWPYNHLRIVVTRLETPDELATLVDTWGNMFAALEPGDSGDAAELHS